MDSPWRQGQQGLGWLGAIANHQAAELEKGSCRSSTAREALARSCHCR